MAEEVVVTKRVKSPTGVLIGMFYSDNTVRIDGGICSYPHYDAPWAMATAKNPNPKKTYQGTLLLPKKEYRPLIDELKILNDSLLKAAQIDFVKPDAKYLRDGNATGKPENVDRYIVSCKEERRPACRDGRGNLITEPEKIKELFYPGCIVSCLIRPWAQKSVEYGKRLNNGFSAVRFMRDGERIGEGGITDEEIDRRFADLEENGGFDDDDSLDDL